MRVNWSVGAAHAGCVAFGVVLGVIIAHARDLTFRPEVRVDNLIGLLISILLFLLVNVLLQRHIQLTQHDSDVLRKENELLTRLLEDLLGAADDVNATFQSCHSLKPLPPECAAQIKDALLKYNNAAHTAGAALEICGIKKNSIGFDEVEGQRSAYRDILTDDPFPAAFRDGIFREQQGHHMKVKDTIIKIILEVNKRSVSAR